ncbi:MAG: HU family DNA-binding protein [Bacilli bacterium]|nr:HU family DNA-binding protein [Bacilli bacterium]
MTKQNLVNYMAEETGMTKADATRALDAVLNGIVKGLKDEGKVTLTGSCTFTKQHKAARQGRNPRTGEAVTIPARNAVSIKAGAKLKDAMN